MLVAVGGYKTPDRERNGYCVLVDRQTRVDKTTALSVLFGEPPGPRCCVRFHPRVRALGISAWLRCAIPPGMNALASKLRPMK